MAEYGVLSLADDGRPLRHPFELRLEAATASGSIVRRRGVNAISCGEGPRLRSLWLEKTLVLPEKFSTLYQSVVVSGTVTFVDDDTERMRALELIIDKYSPAFKELGMKYAAGSFAQYGDHADGDRNRQWKDQGGF